MTKHHPKSIVELHVGMFTTSFEDLGSVVSPIELHNQSCLVLLEVFDASMKTRHQRDVALVKLRWLLRRWSGWLQQYNTYITIIIIIIIIVICLACISSSCSYTVLGAVWRLQFVDCRRIWSGDRSWRCVTLSACCYSRTLRCPSNPIFRQVPKWPCPVWKRFNNSVGESGN